MPDRHARLIESIRELVVTESPTEDIAACECAVRAGQAVCADWLGVPAELIDIDGRPALRWGPARPRILLLGHLDTVWPIGTLERLPWTHADGRLTGPGVFDMKAGAVVAVAALAELGLAPADGVGLLLTTDEETTSASARTIVPGLAGHTEAALVFEPSIGSAVKSARKGTSAYQVAFLGRAAHAGLEPEKGVNAILSAAEFAVAAAGWADAAAGTTVTPTTLHAGTSTNTVPAEALLTLDVRAWSNAEQVRVDAAVRAWRASIGDVEVRGGIRSPAMEARMSAGLLALATQEARRLGQPGLEHAAVGGASDGNLTAAAGIPTLDGLGAVGDGAHADHEWASEADLEPRVELAAAIIARLLASPGAAAGSVASPA